VCRFVQHNFTKLGLINDGTNPDVVRAVTVSIILAQK
jgi:hypothetical protein